MIASCTPTLSGRWPRDSVNSSALSNSAPAASDPYPVVATRLAAFNIRTMSSERARGSPGGQREDECEGPIEFAECLGIGTRRLRGLGGSDVEPDRVRTASRLIEVERDHSLIGRVGPTEPADQSVGHLGVHQPGGLG